ncbi:MAG: DNA-binding protein [Mesorhizobium sp.]|nr:MAG: DNA-binding protein [Mesorhizobium sp.]
MQTDQPDNLDLLWGASSIASFLSMSRRQAFHLLENGKLPARKLGSKWVASRSALQRHFAELLDTEAA